MDYTLKEKLVKKLKRLKYHMHKDVGHEKADQLLLDYINDDIIRAAFNNIDKWYD